MPAREVKIIKIPLADKEKTRDYPINFPRMPRMYLELLENKSKIKQDLINKEYIPKTGNTERQENKDEKERRDGKEEKRSKSDRSKSDRSKSDKLDNLEISTTENDSDKSKSESISDSSVSKSDKSDSSNDSISNTKSEIESEKEDESNTERENTDNEDDLSERLKELLGDTNTESEKKSKDKYSKSSASVHSSVSNKTSRYLPYEMYKEKENVKPAPTLAELEQKGQYQNKQELRDISHIPTSEYDEEDKKRELIFKFDLLKKSYPSSSVTIPEYTVFSNLHEMQKTYETTLKRLSLDSTVENYKNYLISGFMLVEYVLGNFLGFDMQGFTQQQIVNIHAYEKLLIELGEKSYVPTGSKWPVELRLLFIIIMNAGIFIVGKMIMRKTGANLLGMMNSVNNNHNNHNHNNNITPQPENRQKRRMKGPNINLDNIPDINTNNNNNTNNNPNNNTNNTNNANNI